ncbi:MAG: NADH-quinone oxidoreductase subunit D, partial [Planctomycetota bacterium]|nr:NADH-quinone oxidoreductase subunit D [Planctomycetota bacterium]
FPPRASYILTIMGELSRIADHIICVGLMAMDMGAFSVMLWTFVEREKLYDIFEAVTGQRMMTSYTRTGGLFRDIPPEFPAMVRSFCSKLPDVLGEIEYMLDRNPIWLGRTKGVGVITKEDAISYSLSGPVARASGLACDVRKDRPYLAYRELDFDVVTDTAGDSFARYRVRMGEMRQSLRIVEQALTRLPDGPVKVDDYKISLPPKHLVYTDMEALIHHFKNIMPGHGPRTDRGEIYSCTESPNGELGFFLVSDGTGVPYRLRVRPPSFYNYQIFPKIIEGLMISDAVAVLGSLNIIAGELDR